MGANATKSRDITDSVNQSCDNEWETSPNKLYLRRKEKTIDKDINDNLKASNKRVNYNENRTKSLRKTEERNLQFKDQQLSKERFSKQKYLKVCYD